MKKGIIFDVDGTLWNACSQIADAWNECVRQHDPAASTAITGDDVYHACGLPMDLFGRQLLESTVKKDLMDMVWRCCDYEVGYIMEHPGDIYPGVGTAMKELISRGYSLYIVSNCQDGYIEGLLHAAGAGDLISDTQCYFPEHPDKGENIRWLCERNSLDAAVYVGDTAGDEAACRKAGIPFIYASYGYGEANEPDGTISELSELPDAADRIFAKL